LLFPLSERTISTRLTELPSRLAYVSCLYINGPEYRAVFISVDTGPSYVFAESRLLQAADLIAHATWLLYERRDPTLIRSLLPAFETPDGVPHGLVHVKASSTVVCDCPACCVGRQPGPVTSL
jgi:hypothetical protein